MQAHDYGCMLADRQRFWDQATREGIPVAQARVHMKAFNHLLGVILAGGEV